MFRLSMYISVICVVLLMSSGVHAQTPTPHPNALQPGIYQFEDLSSPEIELTGIDWTICPANPVVSATSPDGLCNDDPSETLTFFVEDTDYLEFQTQFFSGNSYPGFEICIESNCDTYDLRWYETFAMFAFAIGGNAEIVITTTRNANPLFLDYLVLHPFPVDLSAISGTGGSSPTPTPEPYYIYGSISGSNGDVDTRFDMIVTVGDVAIASALLFLMFSAWAFFFLVVIPRRNDVGK